MSEPDPSRRERTEATGTWAADASLELEPAASSDSPTIRSPAGGSSSNRVPTIETGAAVPLPKPGEVVDSFELEESIGVGGMGAVFRARDSRLDRLVALKILPPEQSNDSDSVQRFYQEGRAAARLDHENIARVFTIGHDSRHHYIAFEYIEGTTIRRRVIERGGPLSMTEAINYTLQIADALVHATERGVVHRDIKPSNIIITPQGRAKLVDMGLARRFESGVDDGLTQSGMTLGTFDYISPEQARDPRSVDVRGDLYSLGCTLFYMLAEHPPFPEGTVLQKLLQHQEESPPDLRTINPAVTREMSAIVVKLMAKDRERRYQTPEQLTRDLLSVAGSMGLRSISPEGLVWIAPTDQPVWERHLIWAIPATAFSLIVGVLIWSGRESGRSGVAETEVVSTDRASADSSRPSLVDPKKETASESSIPPRIVPAPVEIPSRVEETPSGFLAEVDASPAKPIRVGSTENLFQKIALAPPRSTLILDDSGPYRLADFKSTVARLKDVDLTIKAAEGVVPVVVSSVSATSASRQVAALDFLGGDVIIEGIEFVQDSSPAELFDLSNVAIRAEGTRLTLRDCLFRRSSIVSAPFDAVPKFAALKVVNSLRSARDGDRPPELILERCHFDAGQIGVLANGPLDLAARDCSVAALPAVWLENSATDAPVPSDLSFRHVGFLAGTNPVFKFIGSSVRVVIDDSVIAPEAGGSATVVSDDHPEGLVWRGRGNLYSMVSTFLLPNGGLSNPSKIQDPQEWAETERNARERGSQFLESAVWDRSGDSKKKRSPRAAFRLAPGLAAATSAGIREDESNRLSDPDRLFAGREAAAGRLSSQTDERTTTTESTSSSGVESAILPKATQSALNTVAAIDPMPLSSDEKTPMPMPVATKEPDEADDAADLENIVEMPVMPPPPIEQVEAAEFSPKATAPGPTTSKEKSRSERTSIRPELDPFLAGFGDLSMWATPSQPKNDLAEINREKPGEPAILRDGSRTSPSAFGSERSRRGASGRRRRRLGNPLDGRPRPRHLENPSGRGVLRGPNFDFCRRRRSFRRKTADSWSSMIDLRSGSFHLDGFDVILPRSNAPRSGSWSAFNLATATDLGLTNCTVTIEGDEVPASVVSISSSNTPLFPIGAGNRAPDANSPAATVRIQNSLIRVGGDLFTVLGAPWISLDLDNAVVATSGSLLHADGIRRGGASREDFPEFA